MAILFVTHFLDQVYAVSDRITVLRNGQLVGEYRGRGARQAALVAAMVGREAGPACEPAAIRPRTSRSRRGPARVRCALTSAPWRVCSVNLEMQCRERSSGSRGC